MSNIKSADEFAEKLLLKLLKPDRWTKGKYARDKNNKECEYWEKKAKCRCVDGAIEAIQAPLTAKDMVMKRIKNIIGGGSIPVWNDSPHTTHAEVLDVLRKAARFDKPDDLD